jgi:RecA-family ATPase
MTMSPAEKRLLDAIEEYAAARRAVGLPPPGQAAEGELTPEQKALERHVQTFITDVDAGSAGPFPDFVEDLAPPADPDAFLVGGFIRPGTTVMLTGPPGSSKSWAARQLAMAAAAGLESFLGTYAIERPLNVLVLDEDNGYDEEWRRDQTLLRHLELPPDAFGRRLRRLSLGGVQLDQERWQHWLRGQIQMYSVDLVICDPISEMHGGKELREDPAFRSMLGFLKRLKVDFPRLATLLVHHTRKAMPGDKGSDRSLDDVRGQWGQTPDVVALMWSLAERRVTWELHKRVAHSKLFLEATEAGPLVFKADETTSRSRAMQNDDAVIDAIRGGLTTFAEIQDGISMAKGTLSGVLKRLVQSKTVAKDGAVYTVIEEEK